MRAGGHHLADGRGGKTRLGAIEREHGLPGNRLFYLAIPPSLIATCVRGLRAAGIVSAADDPRFTRVVVEKPIDRDLPSARQLNEVVAKAFAEGLPDRPLPRQGDRAEPPGPALRQHVSRAPLEQ